jgi:hypothetical protein
MRPIYKKLVCTEFNLIKAYLRGANLQKATLQLATPATFYRNWLVYNNPPDAVRGSRAVTLRLIARTFISPLKELPGSLMRGTPRSHHRLQ